MCQSGDERDENSSALQGVSGTRVYMERQIRVCRSVTRFWIQAEYFARCATSEIGPKIRFPRDFVGFLDRRRANLEVLVIGPFATRARSAA